VRTTLDIYVFITIKEPKLSKVTHASVELVLDMKVIAEARRVH
jgi:hypothetical protein